MNASEARRLIETLKRKTHLTDSEAVIHESLKFFAWIIAEQEDGNSIYLEQGGCFEDIILLYERSKQEAASAG